MTRFLYMNIEPTAKARPRMARNGHVYTPRRTADYEKRISEGWVKANGATPEEGAVNVSIEFGLPIPKSYNMKKRAEIDKGRLRPTSKPDVDNLAKAVLDALNGIAYTDDSRIVSLEIYKRYNEEPYVFVKVKGAEK